MAFKGDRWTIANVLPIIFVTWIITTIWFLYAVHHLLHLLQNEDPIQRRKGVWQAAISQSLTVMLMICFLRSVFTDPGSVPDSPDWIKSEADKRRVSLKHEAGYTDPLKELPASNELKQTGERRHCKWCDKYKPDRCHHCRVCRSCILRMDHHCPWIANCVGFRNHKYFFLLVFYALLNCMFIIGTMWESVLRAGTEEMLGSERFLMVFGMTLACIMAVLLKVFFGIHVSLMLRTQTTIEYCEKRSQRSKAMVYHHGSYSSIQAVLGPSPMLWFLPFAAPEGDGLHFEASGQEDIAADEDKQAPFLDSPPTAGGPRPKANSDTDDEAEVFDGPSEQTKYSALKADDASPEVTGQTAAAA